jgi:hypothetical protein
MGNTPVSKTLFDERSVGHGNDLKKGTEYKMKSSAENCCPSL